MEIWIIWSCWIGKCIYYDKKLCKMAGFAVLFVVYDLTMMVFNKLWPCDTMWWHQSRSTLAQVMAYCLTAPSHYLNQCWLKWDCVALTWDQFHRKCWKYHFVLWVWKMPITSTSPRTQWVCWVLYGKGKYQDVLSLSFKWSWMIVRLWLCLIMLIYWVT